MGGTAGARCTLRCECSSLTLNDWPQLKRFRERRSVVLECADGGRRRCRMLAVTVPAWSRRRTLRTERTTVRLQPHLVSQVSFSELQDPTPPARRWVAKAKVRPSMALGSPPCCLWDSMPRCHMESTGMAPCTRRMGLPKLNGVVQRWSVCVWVMGTVLGERGEKGGHTCRQPAACRRVCGAESRCRLPRGRLAGA